MDKELQEYVEKSLISELRIIRNSERANKCVELTEFDKAIIYHYSDHSYKQINKSLREGTEISGLDGRIQPSSPTSILK